MYLIPLFTALDTKIKKVIKADNQPCFKCEI